MLAAGSDLTVNTPDQEVIAKREKFGELTALAIGFQGLADRMVDDFCREADRADD